MGARTRIAVLAGKAAAGMLRALGRHATTMPGAVALKICPSLLRDLSGETRVVLVTGTNGKTTTTHLIAGMCEGAGHSVLTNSGGANMTAGLAAAFVADCGRGGKPRAKVAVLECDEAYVRTAAKALQPQAIVVTNLFRDQLDRWGEVSHIRDVLQAGLDAAPQAVAVLNADDSLVASMAESRDGALVRLFGLGEAFAEKDGERAGDDSAGTDAAGTDAVPVPLEGITCPRCGSALQFAWRTYGHLGRFACPGCGFTWVQPQVQAIEMRGEDDHGTAVAAAIDGNLRELHLALQGTFNLYNAMAALACAPALGISDDLAVSALAGVTSSFGRMETFTCGETPVRIILVKNPVGLDRALAFLGTAAYPRLFFGLNDKTGDGTDISWIWDANLEGFFAETGDGNGDSTTAKPQVMGVFGTRAEDMALRLKYAGADMGRVVVLEGYPQVVDAITADSSPVCILANYTAMYDLRSLLGQRFGLGDMA